MANGEWRGHRDIREPKAADRRVRLTQMLSSSLCRDQELLEAYLGLCVNLRRSLRPSPHSTVWIRRHHSVAEVNAVCSALAIKSGRSIWG